MSEQLRWGILGTGNIARQLAAGVSGSRSSRVIAVGSRRDETAQAFAGTFQLEHALSYDGLLASKEIDVIYNSLPNSMHREWTIAALRAGKHVLCEKPLAASAAEAQEMFDVAGRQGRILMEAFMYRSHPQTLAVIEAVRAGAIGKLKLIRSSFCYSTRRIADNIRFSPALAGGALMDVGCYCINFSRLFAGAEPDRTDVIGHIHEAGVDHLAAGMFSFPGGIFATFACGMTVHADNTAYLCGSEGYIQIPIPWKPPINGAGFTITRSTPPRMDGTGRSPPARPPREYRAINAGADLYAIETDDFADAILNSRPPRITPQDSIGNMRVLDQMRWSLGSGR